MASATVDEYVISSFIKLTPMTEITMFEYVEFNTSMFVQKVLDVTYCTYSERRLERLTLQADTKVRYLAVYSLYAQT